MGAPEVVAAMNLVGAAHAGLGSALAGLREAIEGEPPNVRSEVLIQADPSRDAYALLRSKLGPSALECPDLWGSNHPGNRHITQLAGGPTGAYFRFPIHPQDGDKSNRAGRPLNEIKADSNSPGTVKAFEGNSMRLHWYFRIAANYSKGGDVDSEHILHQLHSTGVNGPIVKFEMRNGQLSVSHDSDNTNQNEVNLASTSVGPLLGQWLEAEEIIRFDDGYYQVIVRNEAGIVLQAERKRPRHVVRRIHPAQVGHLPG